MTADRWNGRVSACAHWDDTLGYADYLSACRTRGGSPDHGDGDLARTGLLFGNLLAPEICARISATFDDGFHGTHFFEPGPVTDSLARAVLGDAVSEQVRDVFGCDFMLLWMTFNRLRDAEGLGWSNWWHFDLGPSMQAKVIVYLTGPESHDSTTLFLDAPDSARYMAAGYGEMQKDNRLLDLAPYAEEHGLPMRIQEPVMRSGASVLFQPTRILHRGIAPTRGIRDTLFLLLIPSPVPFDRAGKAFGVPYTHDQWPPMARRLGESEG